VKVRNRDVFISVGSNKGSGKKNILKALNLLGKKIKIKKISSFIKTFPAEGAEGKIFLNGVVQIQTAMTASSLFSFLKQIEKRLGRSFPHKRGDAREIDLDIIFFGDEIIEERNLKIPHRKFHRRTFVLKPLTEISAEFKDPESGKKIKDLYRELINGNKKNVRKYKKKTEKT
jgi:2-amino-4-hydroxy-6-hydroxymethyldihydropteridine diphosphokinase